MFICQEQWEVPKMVHIHWLLAAGNPATANTVSFCGDSLLMYTALLGGATIKPWHLPVPQFPYLQNGNDAYVHPRIAVS
jgi:hypothetical protein